jgi:hypothetical protein
VSGAARQDSNCFARRQSVGLFSELLTRGEPVALGRVVASVLGEGVSGRIIPRAGGLGSEPDDTVPGVGELRCAGGCRPGRRE